MRVFHAVCFYQKYNESFVFQKNEFLENEEESILRNEIRACWE